MLIPLDLSFSGYAVTSFGQDGFAILKKERVLESLEEGSIPNEEEPDI